MVPEYIKKNKKVNYGSLAVVLAGVVVIGLAMVSANAARKTTSSPSGPSLYLSPSSGSYASGSTVTIAIHENSLTQTVNAVQANLTYPDTKLKFVSADTSSSAFEVSAENTGTGGVVHIARGTTTPISGDKLVANLTFQVTGSHSTVPIQFTAGSAIVSSSTNTSILSTTTNASLRIK